MPKAVTAERMKALDKAAINRYGIPGILLMENAGRGLAREVIKRAARLKKARPRVAIYCGKGNNGGDGMVCARYLFSKDIDTRVFLLDEPSSIKGHPAIHLKILQTMGVPVTAVKSHRGMKSLIEGPRADIIVDAIFGIGFKGEARSIYREAIKFINIAEAYIFSVDIPSGLEATTGKARGPCIRADQTIAMGLPKTGFYKNDGPECVGKIKVVDIGLPRKSLRTREG